MRVCSQFCIAKSDFLRCKNDINDHTILDSYAQATARSKSGTVTNLHLVDIKTIKIPLPPIAVQKQIVAEIEAEQALVAANRQLIARFEQKIQAALARVWGEEADLAVLACPTDDERQLTVE